MAAVLPGMAIADEEPAVKWQWQLVRPANAGDAAEIVFTADIPAGWILYSSDFTAELGPRPAKFSFDANDQVALIGAIEAVKPLRRTDKTFGTEYSYFEKHAQFRQKVKVGAAGTGISGHIAGQTCQEKDGLCSLYRQSFSLSLP